jgi:hypothetical protein
VHNLVVLFLEDLQQNLCMHFSSLAYYMLHCSGISWRVQIMKFFRMKQSKCIHINKFICIFFLGFTSVSTRCFISAQSLCGFTNRLCSSNVVLPGHKESHVHSSVKSGCSSSVAPHSPLQANSLAGDKRPFSYLQAKISSSRLITTVVFKFPCSR